MRERILSIRSERVTDEPIHRPSSTACQQIGEVCAESTITCAESTVLRAESTIVCAESTILCAESTILCVESTIMCAESTTACDCPATQLAAYSATHVRGVKADTL